LSSLRLLRDNAGMRIALLLLALLLAAPVAAQPRPTDIPGARDHPLVGRYEGALMRFQRPRDYDEFRMVNRPVLARDTRETGSRINDRNSIPVSGRAWRLRYEGPEGRSALEVMRNHQERLAANGFETVFACRGNECGQPAELWFAVTEAVQGPSSGLHSGWENQLYTLAKLSRPEGDVHVGILAITQGQRAQVLVDVVESRPMQGGRITFVDASAMQRAVEQTGRVALYGIQFGFDSAEILPASRPTLEEIARFLRANAALNVVVAGHTDAQGGFDYNVQLSGRRAQAVVAALTRDFGLAASRLTAFGAGMAAPVASNDNDAGRAQNRRVEIVKR
jgi:outer membrane protein OmpA-like peptidoglycan-associated protein